MFNFTSYITGCLLHNKLSHSTVVNRQFVFAKKGCTLLTALSSIDQITYSMYLIESTSMIALLMSIDDTHCYDAAVKTHCMVQYTFFTAKA